MSNYQQHKHPKGRQIELQEKIEWQEKIIECAPIAILHNVL